MRIWWARVIAILTLVIILAASSLFALLQNA